jgi:hypothetical protein
MTTNKGVAERRNKAFDSAVSLHQLSAVEQIIIEIEWTVYLQSLLDFANKHYFRNFSLRLEMEERL